MAARLAALIAAAGSGTRAGLPYPKTLHPVRGRPILLRLLDRLEPHDPRPTVIVSPSGEGPVAEALEAEGRAAHLLVQERPTGMGDAVLAFRRSPAFAADADVLLAWGDIPLLEEATIARLVERHRAACNDFTFASRPVDAAYTRVVRDSGGRVTALEETRERGIEPAQGERDIGLFLFRAGPVLDLLDRHRASGLGQSTGEHGFLYIVAHAAAAGLKVEALPIATEQDCISLNRLSDLEGA